MGPPILLDFLSTEVKVNQEGKSFITIDPARLGCDKLVIKKAGPLLIRETHLGAKGFLLPPGKKMDLSDSRRTHLPGSFSGFWPSPIARSRPLEIPAGVAGIHPG
jgi:hypothetical protein